MVRFFIWEIWLGGGSEHCNCTMKREDGNDSLIFWCSDEGCQMKWQGASCETSQRIFLFLWSSLVTHLNIFVFGIKQDLNWWPSCAWGCQRPIIATLTAISLFSVTLIINMLKAADFLVPSLPGLNCLIWYFKPLPF